MLLMAFSSGCSFLLPRARSTTRSKWQSYHEVEAAFGRIEPGSTPVGDLASLGFDPATNANVRILTYLDVVQRFMPNQSITKADLDPLVRVFIENREQGQAWEIEISDTKSERYGNAFLDVAGFVKKTHETGWQFRGLLLIHRGRVIYKLASGQPQLDRYEKRVQPLGPLQELDNVLLRAAVRSR